MLLRVIGCRWLATIRMLTIRNGSHFFCEHVVFGGSLMLGRVACAGLYASCSLSCMLAIYSASSTEMWKAKILVVDGHFVGVLFLTTKFFCV